MAYLKEISDVLTALKAAKTDVENKTDPLADIQKAIAKTKDLKTELLGAEDTQHIYDCTSTLCENHHCHLEIPVILWDTTFCLGTGRAGEGKFTETGSGPYKP